jgi:hypothetical protein
MEERCSRSKEMVWILCPVLNSRKLEPFKDIPIINCKKVRATKCKKVRDLQGAFPALDARQ